MTKTTPFFTVDLLPTDVPIPMDSDDQTEVASSGSGKIRQETREILLNWCLEGATDHHQAKKTHGDILGAMLAAFPNELVAIDQTNQELHYNDNIGNDRLKTTIAKAKFTFHSALSTREKTPQALVLRP